MLSCEVSLCNFSSRLTKVTINAIDDTFPNELSNSIGSECRAQLSKVLLNVGKGRFLSTAERFRYLCHHCILQQGLQLLEISAMQVKVYHR